MFMDTFQLWSIEFHLFLIIEEKNVEKISLVSKPNCRELIALCGTPVNKYESEQEVTVKKQASVFKGQLNSFKEVFCSKT